MSFVDVPTFFFYVVVDRTGPSGGILSRGRVLPSKVELESRRTDFDVFPADYFPTDFDTTNDYRSGAVRGRAVQGYNTVSGSGCSVIGVFEIRQNRIQWRRQRVLSADEVT